MREENGMFVISIDPGSEVLVNEHTRKVVFTSRGIKNEHTVNVSYDLSRAQLLESEIKIPKRDLNEGQYKQLLHD